MIETHIRPIFQKICIDPIAKQFAKHTQPNTITLCSLLIGLFAALCIALDWRITAVIFMLLSGYCDVLDGTVARLNNQSSDIGTLLDIMSDRTVEVAIILCFAFRAPDYAILYLLMMGVTLLCVSSFLVVGIFSTNTSNKSFYYSPGLMERAEAFIFFIVIILIPSWQLWVALVYIILVLWTAGFRLFEFHKNIKRNSK
ncbi:CDP-alcohol phosphatidyltransferase family protein [Francisellaceae bacterium]|nr:CDP-alcohol phosphatidyltransferase family protein [Francisellaceae bacterium]